MSEMRPCSARDCLLGLAKFGNQAKPLKYSEIKDVRGVVMKKPDCFYYSLFGHVDDEEEGRALTCRLPSTVTQRFIHAHRLV